jgi:hypothetical protein
VYWGYFPSAQMHRRWNFVIISPRALDLRTVEEASLERFSLNEKYISLLN